MSRRGASRSSASILLESAREAAVTVRANPLRSTLAAFAMAAAVATGIVVRTALDGVEFAARAASEAAFGANTFILARVFPGQLGRRELAEKLQRNPPIDNGDVRFLRRYGEDEALYAPTALAVADVSADGITYERAAVSGTTAELDRMRDLGIEAGRFFVRQEDRDAAQVAVLGANVATELFAAGDAIGQTVRIAGRGFRVIGLQRAQGTAGGASLDRYVWVPFGAYERTFGAPESLQIYAAPPPGGDVIGAQDRATATMRARRRLLPGVADNFEILAPEAARSFVEALTGSISAAGAPISTMALLAAVVVVVNTTLVSVSQRTFEIGIRRAVGAARAQIMVEVLTESTLLGIVGGLTGVIVALATLEATAAVLATDLPLRASTVATATVAAALAGLASGWYPARRAASIDIATTLQED